MIPSRSNPCEEKERLKQRYKEASAEYQRFLTAQMEAIGRSGRLDLEDEVCGAYTKCSDALDAIMVHMRRHGC